MYRLGLVRLDIAKFSRETWVYSTTLFYHTEVQSMYEANFTIIVVKILKLN